MTDVASPASIEFRCAPWTEALGADPIGSAATFDTLIVVEIPLPWPKDIGMVGALADLDLPANVRLQGVIPDADRLAAAGVLVTIWQRRNGGNLEGSDLFVAPGDIRATVSAVASRSIKGPNPIDPETLPMVRSAAAAPPEVLVCSHGSRDVCCGGPGTRLATEARAMLGDDIRVRRTSHLGGHRFAPTALTLPDGRTWAYLNTSILEAVVRRTAPPAELRAHYRGNSALAAPVQVLEAQILTDHGWFDPDAMTHAADLDGDATSVSLTVDLDGNPRTATGIVDIVARHPVLQCGLDPSHAQKTSPEFRLRSEP